MVITKVQLDSIDKVKRFVNQVSCLDCELDLVSGRYVVDAKSIMGIFSIDLSQPIELRIHDGTEKPEHVVELLKDYIVTDE
ncbi:MAG: HPr family phosphocarrier protein [Butyricicoccus sp.]|nr:HPr family phosphocarrier protein [Butyricicoccus sp.]